MKRGLVFENKIIDVKESDFEVHSSMRWIDVSDSCEIGWEVVNNQAIEPNGPTAEELLSDLRLMRNTKLRKSDWLVTRASEQGIDIPLEWKTYRQALRDITNTYTSVYDVVWPTEPSL